ncbi:MAG: aldose epimerase family protein [Steroidobacteraceae bacterium]
MITSAPFGCLSDGARVSLVTLRGSDGVVAEITNYGGTITRLMTPDRSGHWANVVLGFESLADYVERSRYVGALIGRCANRIANAEFTLDGRRFSLTKSDGANALHGGVRGFDRVAWNITRAGLGPRGPELVLTHRSPDGEEGYPGTLFATATYRLIDHDALEIDLAATTDRPTIVNLTHHSYFNLRGRGDILEHVVQIAADSYTPVADAALIPTGEIATVAGTAFDFRDPTPIGARIDAHDPQLHYAKGYDHNWVINQIRGRLTRQASVYEPDSGRILEVWSTEPGLQFYTGNSLDESPRVRGACRHRSRSGFAMEPQAFPDAPNQPSFPSTVLRPKQTYSHTIVYRFRTDHMSSSA